MPKVDPALLDPARYPFRYDVDTRYSDLDPQDHVNNVALIEIIQEGRLRFHRASKFQDALAGRFGMIASLSVDYLGVAQYLAPCTVHVGVLAIGRTSHTLVKLVTQADKAIALGKVVVVCVENDQPVENDPAFAKTLEKWMFKS